MNTQATFNSVRTRLLELQFVQYLQTTSINYQKCSLINFMYKHVYFIAHDTPTAADVRYQQL